MGGSFVRCGGESRSRVVSAHRRHDAGEYRVVVVCSYDASVSRVIAWSRRRCVVGVAALAAMLMVSGQSCGDASAWALAGWLPWCSSLGASSWRSSS